MSSLKYILFLQLNTTVYHTEINYGKVEKYNHQNKPRRPQRDRNMHLQLSFLPQKPRLLSTKVDMQIYTLVLLLKDNPFLGGIITVCDLAVAMAAGCVLSNKVLSVVR